MNMVFVSVTVQLRQYLLWYKVLTYTEIKKMGQFNLHGTRYIAAFLFQN